MVATLAQLAYLRGDDGTALLRLIPGGESTPADTLRLGEHLRKTFPAEMVAAALTLVELRRRARTKFSRAGAMWFTRPGLEQASSERMSRHRAERFRGAKRIADLCTGIGGDLLALAPVGPVLAVDRDPLPLALARANAEVYGVEDAVSTLAADVRDVDLDGIEAVFVDPARRTERGRSGPGASEPPLAWCCGLTDRVARVGIKAAPALDLDRVPDGWEIEFVAEGRELKEAALWSPALATASHRATILPAGDTLAPMPGEPVAVAGPGAYLLDPNPAVTRAGLVEDLARLFGAWKIDDRIAFLASDRPVRTPFARTLQVVESLPWHQKRVGERLRALGVGAVDIRRRGLAGDVEAIRRGFRLAGERRVTLAMTRVAERPWCLICEDVGDDAG